VPIADDAVDLALFSQSLHHALHPERAVAEAWRILKPGGRVTVLDLLQHRFAEARELYADVWLGFSEVQLEGLLENAGFETVHTAVVHKETEAPFFQTVLATGIKANA
jgi:ubiquinone/menaquinone biosynthesis C-methylase UbiE